MSDAATRCRHRIAQTIAGYVLGGLVGPYVPHALLMGAGTALGGEIRSAAVVLGALAVVTLAFSLAGCLTGSRASGHTPCGWTAWGAMVFAAGFAGWMLGVYGLSAALITAWLGPGTTDGTFMTMALSGIPYGLAVWGVNGLVAVGEGPGDG
ncbi:hypothetical protein ACGFNU_02630 [Spirillospora sp. NPDC048911]|uniref:hypothetical protein n=1 Tax=Spirillospora sp. NPDC048911 TaxID=3364527 RepID=UPI00371E293F